MEYILYGNGGSGNHGCEAIVRGTKELLDGKMLMHSKEPEEDMRYGLDELATIVPAISVVKKNFTFWKSYLKLKITGNYTDMDGLPYLSSIEQAKGKTQVALSVGGDNYCYSNQSFYAFLNRAYQKNGFKTILWGCSVEPTVIRDMAVARDLKSYSLITARESITFNALKEIGANVILSPDPAFYMKFVKCDLDPRFADGNIVGINISPLIISSEHESGIAYDNYKKLVQYILDCTDMKLAFIPHVVWKHNDDRTILQQLYDDFNQDERIILVNDHKAPELKYIISQCRFFVGARTHATIAAYSSCVPTLVVGYSVKARGIAKDLFGTSDYYVVPVQSLRHESQLLEAFLWLHANETKIRMQMYRYVPEYKNRVNDVKKILEEYYEK